ncbi:hypothetical protein MY11210_009541 [Beauveria gryllotalpidicola]
MPQNMPSSQPSAQLKAVSLATARFWILSIGMYLGLFLAIMDAIIIASSLHTIATEFGILASVNWVALAYMLAECSFGVIVAVLSDIVGRCGAFAVSNCVFIVFSLACGFAHSLEQLVIFRALQGIGGAVHHFAYYPCH